MGGVGVGGWATIGDTAKLFPGVFQILSATAATGYLPLAIQVILNSPT
jgi:hypothetical protein